MELGVLVSGALGYRALKHILDEYTVNFVLTDKNSTGIIDLCKERKIPFYAGNPRNGEALGSIPHASCDVLVSVNYLFIVEQDILALPEKLAVNFHGSLLPRYRGRTPHVWAIIQGETETGITAHVMNTGCDTGDILAQKKIPIGPEDTGGTILAKFNQEYPRFISEVLQSIQNSTYTTYPQNEALATTYGKRTPKDGKIDWNWQKEKIANWVRAQTKPYPGAFTFFKEHEMKVYALAFRDCKGKENEANGKIIGFEKELPLVKTANGCVLITDFTCGVKPELNAILK